MVFVRGVQTVTGLGGYLGIQSRFLVAETSISYHQSLRHGAVTKTLKSLKQRLEETDSLSADNIEMLHETSRRNSSQLKMLPKTQLPGREFFVLWMQGRKI